MAPDEQQGAWSFDTAGWEEAIPDREFVGVIRDFLIRDAQYDRFPRPIRTISIRCERLDARGRFEDGEEIPLSVYSQASLERLDNKGNVRRMPRGKNKAALIIDSATKHIPALKTMTIPPPTNDAGEFQPLPEESWVSPKDGETKTANQVHITEGEGVKVRAILRGVVKLGPEYEARQVLEILEVLPPDFAIPEAEVEIVPITREAGDSTAQSQNAAVPGADTNAGATVSDDEEGHSAAVAALVGHTTAEGVEALMAMPEEFRREPFISGLSGDKATLIQQYLSEGRLVEVDGKLAQPS